MTGAVHEPHPRLPELLEALKARRLSRRAFLRAASLLGVAAASAYALAGLAPPVRGAEAKRGGRVRLSMRVAELSRPHSFSWVFDSNAVRQANDYLTRTGSDNVTRPWLLERWQASADLRSWTLPLPNHLRCSRDRK